MRGETFLVREGPRAEPALLGREMQCFLHKQPGLAGAILFLFPIFTSPLALFSSSGLDRPTPSSLHPASWLGPGALGKPSVCVRPRFSSVACTPSVSGSSLSPQV